MAASPKRQLSLDTNVLLDLATPQDFAHEFREEFQRRGYALLGLVARTSRAPETIVEGIAIERLPQ